MSEIRNANDIAALRKCAEKVRLEADEQTSVIAQAILELCNSHEALRARDERRLKWAEAMDAKCGRLRSLIQEEHAWLEVLLIEAGRLAPELQDRVEQVRLLAVATDAELAAKEPADAPLD